MQRRFLYKMFVILYLWYIIFLFEKIIYVLFIYIYIFIFIRHCFGGVILLEANLIITFC